MYNLATVENRGFVDKMKASNRRMVVFYGSQTGTAEEFAGRLAKEGARYGCKVQNLKTCRRLRDFILLLSQP